jgi:hypothetical protein
MNITWTFVIGIFKRQESSEVLYEVTDNGWYCTTDTLVTLYALFAAPLVTILVPTALNLFRLVIRIGLSITSNPNPHPATTPM